MKKIHSTIGLAALALTCAGMAQQAFAQDYQLEVGLSYLGLEPDVGSSDSAFGADLTWHFDRVQTAGRPLAEAAFLGRASNLQLGYTAWDDADIDVLRAGGELYLQNFYLAGAYQRVDTNISEFDDFSVAVGYLPIDGLRLTLGYADDDASDSETISVAAKYVTGLGGGTALNVEGGVAFVDDAADTTLFSARADYYFNPALSLGVTLAHNNNDIEDDTAVGVASRWFFTPAFSIEGFYETADLADAWGVRLAGRF